MTSLRYIRTLLIFAKEGPEKKNLILSIIYVSSWHQSTRRKGKKQRGTNPSGDNHGGNGNRNTNTNNNDEVHGLVFVNKDGKPIGKDVMCYNCRRNHYKGNPKYPNNQQTKVNDGDDYSCVSPLLFVAFVGAQPPNLVSSNS